MMAGLSSGMKHGLGSAGRKGEPREANVSPDSKAKGLLAYSFAARICLRFLAEAGSDDGVRPKRLQWQPTSPHQKA